MRIDERLDGRQVTLIITVTDDDAVYDFYLEMQTTLQNNVLKPTIQFLYHLLKLCDSLFRCLFFKLMRLFKRKKT